MRCSVCDANDWENVDSLRDTKKNMAMCKGCGFVSYPDRYKSEEEIKEHYRKDYRQAPTVQNLFSSERKIYYHEAFLRPLIEEWKKAGLKPVVGEIGSAMGLFLAWIQKQIDCEVYGTELTTSFRRVAHSEFGLNLTEELDFSRKYDLIASYHVLEHQLDPDVMLKRYAEALSDSGLIYLGTPVWFREACNFGSSGFDLGYYWHPDHINCWSEEHLEHIIAKSGLKIIAKNDNIYGNTYLLQKSSDPLPEKKFDAAKHKEIASRIKAAWTALQVNETAQAIDAWKNTPSAWINHYELNRAMFHKDRPALQEFMKQAIEACPNTSDVLILCGDIYHRYEEFEKSYDLFKKAEIQKPNNPTVLMAMANCIRQRALRCEEEPKRSELFQQAINITAHVRATSLEVLPQATTWNFHDVAQIKMAEEA